MSYNTNKPYIVQYKSIKLIAIATTISTLLLNLTHGHTINIFTLGVNITFGTDNGIVAFIK